MTHFPVTALRSVDLSTPDIGRSERFYTTVWGLDLVTRYEGVTSYATLARDLDAELKAP